MNKTDSFSVIQLIRQLILKTKVHEIPYRNQSFILFFIYSKKNTAFDSERCYMKQLCPELCPLSTAKEFSNVFALLESNTHEKSLKPQHIAILMCFNVLHMQSPEVKTEVKGQ